MGLSHQQKKILSVLADFKPHKLEEFKYLYTACHIYPSVKYLVDKKYIQKVGKFYMITHEGMEIVDIYKLLKLFTFS
jgi:predicted transcriptional regulator